MVGGRSINNTSPRASGFIEPLTSSLGAILWWCCAPVKRFLSLVTAVFLLDELRLSRIFVWIAAYHYVPLLACVSTVLVQCMLHVFFSLIFPVLTERYQRSHYAVKSDLTEDRMAHDARFAFLFAVSHVGLLVGVLLVGYKLLCAVTEAMLESCIPVYDSEAKCMVSFYQTMLYFQKMAASRACLVTYFLMMAFTSGLLYVLCSDPFTYGTANSTRLFWLYLLSRAFIESYILLDMHRRPQDKPLLHTDVVKWWRWAYPMGRLVGIYAVLVWSSSHAIRHGITYALSVWCGGLLYVNLYHVLCVIAAKTTLFLHHLGQTGRDTLHHAHLRGLFAFSVLPIFVLWTVSALLGSLPLSVIHALPVLLLLSSVCQYAQADPASANPTSGHQSGAPSRQDAHPARPGMWCLLRSIVHIAPDIYFGRKRPPRRSALYRVSRLVRAFHRLWIAMAFTAVLGVGLWASAHHPGREYATTTKCIGNSAGDGVQVIARYMVADLYGHSAPGDGPPLTDHTSSSPHAVPRYDGLCARVWGPGLHAADLSYFSLMPYLRRNSTDLQTMLDFYKKYRLHASDWTTVPTNHTYGRAVFRHLYSSSKNTSVIAIRGTDLSAPFDILQNFLLFAETFVFRLLANVLPLSSLLPEQGIVDFIAGCSAFSSFILGNPEAYYYHRHVEEYLKGINSKHIILTGHSLGGVIAHLVGTRNGLESVAFGSPGFSWMRRKVGILPSDIAAYTTSVIVSNDLAVTIDTPGGAVHHIQCEHQSLEVCHSIELHVIRLWAVCPQYRVNTRINSTYKLL